MSHIPRISVEACVDYFDVVECYEAWASDGFRNLNHCPSDEFAARLAEGYGHGSEQSEAGRQLMGKEHKEATEMGEACIKHGRFYIAWGFIAQGCHHCGRTSDPIAKEILDEFRGKMPPVHIIDE